jgi:hypothetical protein
VTTQDAVPPRRAAYAAMAAVLLAIVIPSISWLLWTRAAGQRALPGLAELPSGDQRRLRATLDAGVAEAPPWLAELAGSREMQMGASPAPDGFALVSPVGTAVMDDRPRLQWRPLASASSYTVEVFDDGLRAVASSPPLSGTEWVADQPLPRDRTYAWQVTALRGSESVVAPRAPAPTARFRVVDADKAAGIGRVQASHPESHLLLGLLYLQAGVRPEAERQLAAVPRSDPYAGVARRSLERLKRTRP